MQYCKQQQRRCEINNRMLLYKHGRKAYKNAQSYAGNIYPKLCRFAAKHCRRQHYRTVNVHAGEYQSRRCIAGINKCGELCKYVASAQIFDQFFISYYLSGENGVAAKTNYHSDDRHQSKVHIFLFAAVARKVNVNEQYVGIPQNVGDNEQFAKRDKIIYAVEGYHNNFVSE